MARRRAFVHPTLACRELGKGLCRRRESEVGPGRPGRWHSVRRGQVAKEWITVLRAADAAARWHVHQRRKGAAEEPYVNHLLEVATLVAEATDGKDPDLVIAALLHDAIEDQEVPRTVIAEAFGDAVAKLVEEVTDDKSLEKQERKRRQVQHAHNKSHRAKLLKLADKTSNLRAIAASPPPDWSVKRRLDYVKWARDVAKGLIGVSEWLEREFDQAAKEAERSTVFRR
jgi:guanosine-3',5'-bis(diphosphate) 3'-pyrophosphohydrolase